VAAAHRLLSRRDRVAARVTAARAAPGASWRGARVELTVYGFRAR
jgi:hypothetical protein